MLTPTRPDRQSREITRTHPPAEEPAHPILQHRSEAAHPPAAIPSQPEGVQAARTHQDHHITQETADLHTAAVVPTHQVHLQAHHQAHLQAVQEEGGAADLSQHAPNGAPASIHFRPRAAQQGT